MRGISRLGIVLVLLLAALVAAESTLHHHPLIPGSTALPCPACAIDADRIRVAPPVTIPAVILYLLTAVVALAAPAPAVVALSSRAPPAA